MFCFTLLMRVVVAVVAVSCAEGGRGSNDRFEKGVGWSWGIGSLGFSEFRLE